VGVPELVAVSDRAEIRPEIGALLERMGVGAPYLLSDPLFDEISPLESPSGIVAIVPTPANRHPPVEMDFCLALEDVQDPGNVGSIIRSAAAAGVRHIALSSGCAFAWSPRAIRAGMGGHFLVQLYEHQNLVHLAQAFRGRVVATCPVGATTLFETDLTDSVMLLVGNEGIGLSDSLLRLAAERVTIPTGEAMISLNAAAATAVFLFERIRQRRQRGAICADTVPMVRLAS
jgi:TrmH family RNA methyltransferase